MTDAEREVGSLFPDTGAVTASNNFQGGTPTASVKDATSGENANMETGVVPNIGHPNLNKCMNGHRGNHNHRRKRERKAGKSNKGRGPIPSREVFV